MCVLRVVNIRINYMKSNVDCKTDQDTVDQWLIKEESTNLNLIDELRIVDHILYFFVSLLI